MVGLLAAITGVCSASDLESRDESLESLGLWDNVDNFQGRCGNCPLSSF